jgi:microcystin-dependent protein
VAVLARLYNFAAGTPAVADEVDAELDQLVAGHNDHETRIAAVLPSGTILATAGPTADTGFLLCDGAAVSRTTYAALFARIGTAFGAGDGSTTFNLPDLRGRVPVGKGTHVDVNALADSDGLAVGSRRPTSTHGHSIPFSGGPSTTGFALLYDGAGSSIGVAKSDHGHGFAAPTGNTDVGPAFQTVNYQIKV